VDSGSKKRSAHIVAYVLVGLIVLQATGFALYAPWFRPPEIQPRAFRRAAD